ncbi:MAG: TIGR03663 family protein [Chloroflexi bacterium]|nr:TIGR03663 family protein [Chloroflexota bacterium]
MAAMWHEKPQAEAMPRVRVVADWVRCHWYGLAFLSLVALALGMRLWDLGSRGLGHDEAQHAYFTLALSRDFSYQHTPITHGPFKFFATALLFFLFGDSEFTLRLMPALFGTALVGLPYFLRGYLGRVGALASGVMLAVSPSMLYFSRFARDDIFVTGWTLGLVVLMWRYMETQRRRYLVGFSAVLAGLFITMESSYFVAAVLGGFLFLLALPDLVPSLFGRVRLREFSAPSILLIVLVTLTLPLWAAGVGHFQRPLGLVLANTDWGKGPVGAPIGTSGFIAATTVVAFLAVASILVGVMWRWRLWLLCALVFWAIWLAFFTSFGTNVMGIGSGVWQALGYWWVVQQGEARGGQPWFYPLMLNGTYEFLPLLFALLGAGYAVVKGRLFDKFLLYWAVLIFLAYTIAGEKMPQLLVGVTLPQALLAGRFLGFLVATVPWRRAMAEGWVVALGIVPLALVLLMRAGLLVVRDTSFHTQAAFWLMLAVGAVGMVASAYLAWRHSLAHGVALVSLGLAGLLLAVTVQAAGRASYQTHRLNVEMLGYAEGSPDVPRIAADIRRLAEASGKGKDLPIVVDVTESWPWHWYLRDYGKTSYPCYGEGNCQPPATPPEADVLILSFPARDALQGKLQGFSQGERHVRIWWFPEGYRDITPSRILQRVTARDQWRRLTDFLLYRRIESRPYMSEGYYFYRLDLEQ